MITTETESMCIDNPVYEELIGTMFILQDELNADTNGKDWKSGITKENRNIDWDRCILVESVELLDSLNWKHWKDINAEPDIENVKIELIDIWHFIMSKIMTVEKEKDFSDYINNIAIAYVMLHNVYLDNFKNDSDIKDLNYETIFITDNETTNELNMATLNTNLITSIEKLIKDVVDNKEYSNYIFHFFSIAIKLGMNIDDIYRLYIVKNVLNKFRQNNGYKDGSYIKVILGKEDNVHMINIFEQHGNITPLALYSKYEEFYQENTKK